MSFLQMVNSRIIQQRRIEIQLSCRRELRTADADYPEHIALSQKTRAVNSGKRVMQTSPVPAGFFHSLSELARALTIKWTEAK